MGRDVVFVSHTLAEDGGGSHRALRVIFVNAATPGYL